MPIHAGSLVTKASEISIKRETKREVRVPFSIVIGELKRKTERKVRIPFSGVMRNLTLNESSNSVFHTVGKRKTKMKFELRFRFQRKCKTKMKFEFRFPILEENG